MRYVAKIHVLDVLDTVVVSGYVFDADGAVREGEPPLEFTWQVPGIGAPEPVAWLRDALSRALPKTQPATPGAE